MQKTEGTIFTVLQLVILALLVAAPAFIHFTETDGGPGAKHAAIGISLVAGLVVLAVILSAGISLIILKQRKGLHTKKNRKGVYVYARSKKI